MLIKCVRFSAGTGLAMLASESLVAFYENEKHCSFRRDWLRREQTMTLRVTRRWPLPS